MGNRTDWPELAEEIIQGVLEDGVFLGPPAVALKERLVIEFHNAFVAGQESLHEGVMQVISDLSHVDDHDDACTVASTSIDELQKCLGISRGGDDGQ